MVCDKLSVWAEGRPSHYTLLLPILLVPQAYLDFWLGTLSYNGMGGKPGLPLNLHCHLDSYLSQCYTWVQYLGRWAGHSTEGPSALPLVKCHQSHQGSVQVRPGCLCW